MISQEDTNDFGKTDSRGEGARLTCPNCGTSDISADGWESNGQEASCRVSCEECEYRWYEYYKAVDWESV